MQRRRARIRMQRSRAVQTLLDYLEAGDSIDDFLEGFPTVTREKVVAFLERGAALAVNDAA